MNEFDETKWARWGRKTCTFLIWCFGIASVLIGGLAVAGVVGGSWGLFKVDGTWTLANKTVDLSKVTDPGTRSAVVLAFAACGVLALGAIGWGLFRLRRLLVAVEEGRAFSFQAVDDLVVIGNLLLAGAVGVPAVQDLLGMVIGAAVPGSDTNFQLSPDFTLLLCGFVVRALAVVFAHGVRLESEAELIV